MEEIKNRIQAINNTSHYLIKESKKLEDYRNGFIKNIKPLLDKINTKRINQLFNDKLLFNKLFDEKKYIQYACEITCVEYFALNYSDSFKYEVKLNRDNNKDVDCQFSNNGFTYNIEVKCPTFDAQENQNLENNFLFETSIKTQREFPEALVNILNEFNNPVEGPQYKIPHYMELTLKDYLLDANKKFYDAVDQKTINVLIVCCSNARTMKEFLHYLFMPGGFFSGTPNIQIATPNDYKNVDVVVLSNLYHRHSKYFDKPNLTNHWDLKESFLLVFDNVNRAKSNYKLEGIDNFKFGILPNFTQDFIKFIYTGDWAKEMDYPNKPNHIIREVLGMETYISFLSAQGFNYF